MNDLVKTAEGVKSFLELLKSLKGRDVVELRGAKKEAAKSILADSLAVIKLLADFSNVGVEVLLNSYNLETAFENVNQNKVMCENYIEGLYLDPAVEAEDFISLAQTMGFTVKSFDTLPSGDIVAEGEYLLAKDKNGNLRGSFYSGN